VKKENEFGGYVSVIVEMKKLFSLMNYLLGKVIVADV
jgi:hypothetical protein